MPTMTRTFAAVGATAALALTVSAAPATAATQTTVPDRAPARYQVLDRAYTAPYGHRGPSLAAQYVREGRQYKVCWQTTGGLVRRNYYAPQSTTVRTRSDVDRSRARSGCVAVQPSRWDRKVVSTQFTTRGGWGRGLTLSVGLR